MRILIFSWRDPKHPLSGGAERMIHEHTKGWIKAGHEVTLFASALKGLPKEEVLDKVKIIRRGYQYLGVQISAFLYYLKNSGKFDFLVDQFHGIPFFTPIYSNKPKLAIIHETAKEVWFLNSLPKPINWFVSLLGFITEPLIFKLYKKVPFITVSKSTKLDIARFGIPEQNINVIQNGIFKPKKIILPAKTQIPTITFLGTLSKDKGIEDAIKCFAILNKQGKFNFWVIGRKEGEVYFQKLLRFAKSLGLKKNLEFWGYVSEEQKFKLLSKSHLLLNPSIREGWGLVNIESNLVKTPVVAYPSPGLIDSVKNNISGIISKEKTPQNLAKIVYDLCKDKEKYAKLQNSSYLFSQKFDWKKSTQMSLKLINNLYQNSS
ncbi:glycosyltransferase family 4 protein [Candidatus Daviesbacteria bacterium]|nr:glycosyltransferase family 4 protein [Candidatus Daviesbacteria bacterium]